MRQDLAGKLVVGLQGAWPTAAELQWLETWRPAGVILFSRNVINNNQLIGLCEVLHEASPGLEIVADHEGGPVSQLAAAVGRPPACWSLGMLDDVGLTARVFAETGRRLEAVGLDRVLSPVADVMTEPANPVIGCRAFGAEVTLVTRHTVAAVTGLLGGGVQVCLKHWPGHGGTAVDTHREPAATAAGAIPAPFLAGLKAGADAVMVGHLESGPTDKRAPGQPATLDAEFLSRTRAGFGAGDGKPILYADDVSMGALGPAMADRGVPVPSVLESGMFDPAGLPVTWFDAFATAGCDRILVRSLPLLAFPARAVRSSSRATAPPPSSPVPLPLTEPESYREVRSRNRLRAVEGFFDPQADLCWLDFTAGDRWQVAGGTGADGQDELRALLRSRFRSVTELPRGGPGPPACGRLLVTSHRPQADPDIAGLPLARDGFCLVMGHPDLAFRFGGLLGDKWRIEALYDVHVLDLSPREGPGTNI